MNLAGIGVREERNPKSPLLQSFDNWRQEIRLPHEVPAMVGRRLGGVVRNKCHLVGFVLFDQTQEIFGRITFDVKLRSREFIVDQSPDLGQV